MEIDGGGGGDRANWAPPGAGRREGAVVEARVASMVGLVWWAWHAVEPFDAIEVVVDKVCIFVAIRHVAQV